MPLKPDDRFGGSVPPELLGQVEAVHEAGSAAQGPVRLDRGVRQKGGDPDPGGPPRGRGCVLGPRVVLVAAAVGLFGAWAGSDVAAVVTGLMAWCFATGFLVHTGGELAFERADLDRLGVFLVVAVAGSVCGTCAACVAPAAEAAACVVPGGNDAA
ncbi:hypothetical protein AB0L05_16915 [Nonomuraea pusilla]|uniref:hypothetical protein n=1 Tax=Nonomuraea pusilla TaxID=46177 RepID=UPI003321E4F5